MGEAKGLSWLYQIECEHVGTLVTLVLESAAVGRAEAGEPPTAHCNASKTLKLPLGNGHTQARPGACGLNGGDGPGLDHPPA